MKTSSSNASQEQSKASKSKHDQFDCPDALIARWQVSLALLGPQCGRNRVPGVSTLKITSPPPQKAKPVASEHCVWRMRVVSGNKSWAESRYLTYCVNQCTGNRCLRTRGLDCWNQPCLPATLGNPEILAVSVPFPSFSQVYVFMVMICYD